MKIARTIAHFGIGLGFLVVWGVGFAQPSLQRLWARAGFPNAPQQTAISPDGQIVAIAGRSATVPLVRMRDGLVERELRMPDFEPASTVAFSADGTLLAVGTTFGSVWIIRVSDGMPLQVVYPHAFAATSVAFSRDGQYLVSAAGTVQLTRLSDGALVRTLAFGMSKVAFSPNGNRLLTVGMPESIVWSFPDCTVQLRLPMTNQPFSYGLAAAFSPNEQTLASSYYSPRELRFWDAQNGNLLISAAYPYDPSYLQDLRFTPDGTRIVSAHENAILVWDAATATIRHQIPIAALSLEMSPNGGTFVTTNRFFTRLWDLESLTSINELSSFVERIEDITYTPSGNALVSASREYLRVWDAHNGGLLAGVWAGSPIGTLAVSPVDESLIAVGGRTSGMGLYNWRTRQWVNKWSTSSQPRQMEFSPNGNLLAVAMGTIALFQRLDTNTRFSVSRSDAVLGVRWVDDQRCLILDAVGNLVLWNVSQNRQERALRYIGTARELTLTSRRHLALVNMTDRLELVRVPELTPLRTLAGAPANILSAQLTPNGQYAIAGDAGGRIIVWRTSDGAIVLQDDREIGAQSSVAINRVSVSPRGDYLAYTRSDANLITVRNPFPPTDVNGNGCVDDADLLVVLFTFGSSISDGDVNGDGVVDDADLLQVLFDFGTNCR
jgi:WD40 repeat protein